MGITIGKTEGGGYAVVPADEYEVVVTDIVPGYSEKYESDNLKWVFEIRDAKYQGDEPLTIWKYTSQVYSPQSNLTKFVVAILGTAPDNLDTDWLLNKPVIADVSKKRVGESEDGEPIFKNYIEGLFKSPNQVPPGSAKVMVVDEWREDDEIPF